MSSTAISVFIALLVTSFGLSSCDAPGDPTKPPVPKTAAVATALGGAVR